MIRVGIIGCGSIAKFRHAPEYTANMNSEVAGFYDANRERAEALAVEFGGKVYASYEDMLADKDIDAVSVCTSNEFHAEISIKAFHAGKHVLCEKPMAITLEDCIKMVEAAKDAKKNLMVGHNQRLVPAHVRAKEILKSGEMGKILTFSTTYGHKGPEYWSADKSNNTWFFKKQSSVLGVMADLGIHKLDLLRWLIGEEIVEVASFATTLDKRDGKGKLIEVDDNAVCILKSESGMVGTMAASWTNYGDEINSTVLYCTNGIMKIFDNPEFPIEIIKKNKEKVLYKIGKIQTNDEAQANSGVIDLFIESIVKEIPPEISGEEALAAMKVIFACLESAEKGLTVKLS